MFNWDDLRYFLVLSRAGTLAAAGTDLMLDPTTVGRRVVKFEQRIGAQLFERRRGRYVLTEAGRLLLPWAERMEREAFGAEREIVGGDQRYEGVVRLAATEILATRFIAQHLPEFAKRYPSIELDLICTNGDVSLSRREADLALQLSRPTQEDLIIKRLATVPLAAYASTKYVERYGQPSEKPDGHRLVLFAHSPAFRRESAWLEERIPGSTVAVRADSVSALYAAAVAGSGIALLPTVAASPDPDLVRIDLGGAPEPRQIWQALHSDLRGAARIRAATGFLAEIFSRRTETTAPPRLKAVGPSNPSNVDALGASGPMRHVATSDSDRRA